MNLREQIEHDVYGNIIQFLRPGDIITSCFWAYNATNPVIKAICADYADLSYAVNNIISNMGVTIETALDANHWVAFNQNLRNSTNLTNAIITVYAYIPLAGMVRSSDENGITTNYFYDSFGRLDHIKNDDGEILKKYTYHYKEQ
ncbi:MAG: hypothetical protein HY738_14940 [Bacteroidia bacterium]|nr:hypothetical protein [Bacteroidia bacterium]